MESDVYYLLSGSKATKRIEADCKASSFSAKSTSSIMETIFDFEEDERMTEATNLVCMRLDEVCEESEFGRMVYTTEDGIDSLERQAEAALSILYREIGVYVFDHYDKFAELLPLEIGDGVVYYESLVMELSEAFAKEQE